MSGTGETCTALGGVTLALLAVWTISFVAAHVVPTTWSPVRHAVSEYGVLPHPTAKFIWVCWYTIGVLSIFLNAGLGFVLSLAGPISSDGIAGIVLLAVFAFARFMTPIFPTDVHDDAPEDVKKRKAENQGDTDTNPNGGRRHTYLRSTSGMLHMLFAIISFGSITAASIKFASAFAAPPFAGVSLGYHANVLWGMGWAILATVGLMIISMRVGFFGLSERLFYLAHVLWLYTAASLLVQTGQELS